MSPDPADPVDLSFGDAYDRLQRVAAELGADATMAPDRLIALLREGKGLERALRDHLERVEQEVRAIEDGDGAVPFRIVDGSTSAARAPGAAAPPADGSVPGPEAAPTPAPSDVPAPELPPAAPTLGFVDDDIPF